MRKHNHSPFHFYANAVVSPHGDKAKILIHFQQFIGFIGSAGNNVIEIKMFVRMVN
jgi:hypothetical protein